MLKFIKHNMETIVGIEIFPLISFVIFFLFFLGLLWYVFTMSRQEVASLSDIPFDGNTDLDDPDNNTLS